ncbi:MAG: hypothetical protein LQ352_008271 [Teloschistes flavicans]|nr:MAG: hypothetical protein LQ352_008271 [Teloschistes flavicans]
MTSMLPPPKGYADIGRRQIAPPIDEAGETILCTPGTETFIKMTRKPPHGDMNYDKSRQWIQVEIEQLLGNLWTYISRQHLENGHEDGVISKTEDVPNGLRPLGWIFERTSGQGNFKIQIANAHRRQFRPGYPHGTVRIVGNEITWGVLRAALTALGSYMLIDKAGWTECVFEVWDGFNQVGAGRIVRMTPLKDDSEVP